MTRVLERAVFPGFSAGAERTLLDHNGPGNVRELKNVVERAVWLAVDLDEPIHTLAIDPFEESLAPRSAVTRAVSRARAASARVGLRRTCRRLRGEPSCRRPWSGET